MSVYISLYAASIYTLVIIIIIILQLLLYFYFILIIHVQYCSLFGYLGLAPLLVFLLYFYFLYIALLKEPET